MIMMMMMMKAKMMTRDNGNYDHDDQNGGDDNIMMNTPILKMLVIFSIILSNMFITRFMIDSGEMVVKITRMMMVVV